MANSGLILDLLCAVKFLGCHRVVRISTLKRLTVLAVVGWIKDR